MKDKSIELVKSFYESLSPRGFEVFIKDLLEKLGFDDIEVTQQSGDSGIDLTATLRRSEIPGIETNMPYIIQAKKFAPDKTLNPRYIRELRGAMRSGERGILITTAGVSKKSVEEEALKDISRIVLVIDGEQLIELCMKYEIGVVKQYDIDKDYLSSLEIESEEVEEEVLSKKLVTENDIRARILRIPKDVKEHMGNSNVLTLYFDDEKGEQLKIDKTKTFVSGVTDIFKKYGLIQDDDKTYQKNSEWNSYRDGFAVRFTEAGIKPVVNISTILNKLFGSEYKRISRTAVFISNTEKILCRYSRLYSKEESNGYWYGILPKDVELMKKEGIKKIVFICGSNSAVVMESDYFVGTLPSLNSTNNKDGSVKHYHIHFKENSAGLFWLLKGGKSKKLDNVLRLS